MRECRVCGHAPAADVAFRAHRGYIVMVRVDKETGPYCRECGQATFREVTATTMLHGWWSIVSWAVTPAVMLLNLRARSAVRLLPAPRRVSEEVPPNLRPLPPGRPVFARPQPWAGLVLLATLGTMLGLGIARQVPVAEPGCAQLSESLRVQHLKLVDCAGPHDARVVDIVAEAGACPPGTTRTAEVGPRTYCLVDEMVR